MEENVKMHKITAARKKSQKVRWPGIEPGSIAWKATMLAFTPPTPLGYNLGL